MFNIKDIDLDFIKNYLRIEQEFLEDDNELEVFMMVAKEYLKQVCGFSEDEYLQANTLVPAFLILVGEMYEYRSAMVQTNTKANPLIQRYINANRKFL